MALIPPVSTMSVPALTKLGIASSAVLAPLSSMTIGRLFPPCFTTSCHCHLLSIYGKSPDLAQVRGWDSVLATRPRFGVYCNGVFRPCEVLSGVEHSQRHPSPQEGFLHPDFCASSRGRMILSSLENSCFFCVGVRTVRPFYLEDSGGDHVGSLFQDARHHARNPTRPTT
ncbi:hypothetical protein EDB83DRAFT_2384833 [Lactarius deliciosus]|nr:hypothetical protein EDB83DRAFT_2384833 [Lactarius deliciosus]